METLNWVKVALMFASFQQMKVFIYFLIRDQMFHLKIYKRNTACGNINLSSIIQAI